MIVGKLELGPFATNCYIVGSESNREGMIIDPADKAKEILKRVEDLQLDIKLIALTHGHIDHIGALKKIKEATGAEVAIHADDAGSLRKQPLTIMLGLFYPIPPPRIDYLRTGIA